MANIYFKYIFQHPRMVLAVASLILVFLAFQATKPLPATLTIGTAEIQVPGLTADKYGCFRFYNDEVSLRVTPSRSGTSKARFRLSFTGDPGPVDLNGCFELKYFGGGGIQAECAVILKKGRFKLGRAGGKLKSPEIYIHKAKARLSSGIRSVMSGLPSE